MSFEQLFSSANALAALGWVILVFLPRRMKWLNAIPVVVIPLTLSVLYSYLIARYFFSAEGGFDSLASVQQLFTYPAAALAGWVHYLAFDLFVGGIISRRADELGLSRFDPSTHFATDIYVRTVWLLSVYADQGSDGSVSINHVECEHGKRIMRLTTTAFFTEQQKRLNIWWQGSLFLAGFLAISALIFPFETRLLADELLWAKPIKFEVSVMIHFLTLGVLASLLQPGKTKQRCMEVNVLCGGCRRDI